MWVETLGVLKTVAAVGTTVWTQSSEFKRQYARWTQRLTSGSLLVPVFGGGGVGKSTTAQFLSGMLNPLSPPREYFESIGTERSYHFQRDIVAQFVVPPGQELRVDKHWPALKREIARRGVVGFVNVVSYGYHSSADDLKKHKLYDPILTSSEMVERYATDRRAYEIRLLDELIDAICQSGEPIWMMTVVSKQDLWWRRHDEVREYYEAGPYGERLKSIAERVGSHNFRHEFVPTSLVVSNFKIGSDVFVETAQGYDHSLHVAALTALLRTFESLAA